MQEVTAMTGFLVLVGLLVSRIWREGQCDVDGDKFPVNANLSNRRTTHKPITTKPSGNPAPASEAGGGTTFRFRP